MRLPKFRCKNKTGNWCLFTVLHNGNVNEENFDLETLSQFTGLLDKQGIEIYEGDILEWISGSPMVDLDFGTRVVSISYSGCNLPTYNERALTIIGNIYENPELIQ